MAITRMVLYHGTVPRCSAAHGNAPYVRAALYHGTVRRYCNTILYHGVVRGTVPRPIPAPITTPKPVHEPRPVPTPMPTPPATPQLVPTPQTIETPPTKPDRQPLPTPTESQRALSSRVASTASVVVAPPPTAKCSLFHSSRVAVLRTPLGGGGACGWMPCARRAS